MNGPYRLPSLNVLRVFECAARHLSFKKAANELHISPPAVSHQIRSLEESLGVILFIRLNRGLKLSQEGREYFEKISPALIQLNSATETLISHRKSPVFTINSLPLIASLLVVPNIQSFQDQHPDFRVQIDSQAFQVDFNEDELIDVVIRHRVGQDPDLIYTPLFKVAVTPICSPTYFNDNPEVCPVTLKGARLIKLTVDPKCWPHWASTFNFKEVSSDGELLLSSFRAAVDATRSGVGVAMGYTPPINNMLANGDLIAPFLDKKASYGEACLVYRKKDSGKPIIQAFEQWLLSLVAVVWSDK